MDKIKTIPADMELLIRFQPFSHAAMDDLVVLADHAWVEDVRQGHTLVEAGSSDNWDYYLLEGTIKLIATDGKESFVAAGSKAAMVPLAHLQPRHYTLKAMTPVRYLRVDTQMAANFGQGQGGAAVIDELADIDRATDNPLYMEIIDDLVNDRLVVPSLPKIALKIKQMTEDESVSVPELAKLVNLDPAISAKLLKAANGPLFYGQSHLNTCARAIARLGLNTTRHLVVSFVMRNVFREKISSHLLKQLAWQLWDHSVEVAAISMALAKVTPELDGEEAMLVGLLHDIGELVILSYAEKYPDYVGDAERMRALIRPLKGRVGAALLKEWQFPEEFVVAAFDAENWQREHAGNPDYCDIVQVAQLHDYFGTSRMEGAPLLTEVPAFNKLADGHLTPEMSMHVLQEAHEQIREIRHLLSS